MVATASAVLLTAFGVAALYAGWRKLLPSRATVPAGWGCLVVSFVLWTEASTVELGIAHGFLAIALAAWLVIGLHYEIRRKKDKPQPAAQRVEIDSRGALRHVGTFVIAVPLAGTASVLLSVTIAQLLPWSSVNALAIGAILLPMLFGLASYWACADDKPVRPAAALSLASAACAAYVYL